MAGVVQERGRPGGGAPTRVATVVVADPRPVVRAGLQAVLGEADTIHVLDACTVDRLEATISHHLPSVLVVSTGGAQALPLELVRLLVDRHPALHVLALADRASVTDVRDGVAAGVDSFLLTTALPDELASAVLATARGERAVSPEIAMQLAAARHDDVGGSSQPLTVRELEVVAQLADGRTNQQIAQVLGVSARTVKTHVQNVLVKLDAPDRTGAVATALRRGLIS